MVPARRTKIRQLEQGRNLGMKHGTIGPAAGWIILPSITSHLSHSQITLRLFQIYLPCHTFVSHAHGYSYVAFLLWLYPEHAWPCPLPERGTRYACSSDNASSSTLASCKS